MLERAYSRFEIKSIDQERRILTGIASTPETDRGGDMMDPAGAKFALPMPLRWEHKDTIGQVLDATVTPAGIAITARIASVAEPGKLKEQTDFAWQSVREKLARGFSIGWNPIKATMNKQGGMNVSSWDWLETSIVSIPMNASATIQSIKSFDVDQAALGATDVIPAPGASGLARRNTSMKKNISERVQELKTERKAIATRMETLMQPIVDGTGDMDDAQKKSYDDDVVALNDLDADITRFEALERAAVMPKAQPISGKNFEDAIASRSGESSQRTKSPDLPPGIAFTRAIICKAAGRMNGCSPWEVARARYPSHPEIEAYLKAAVTAQSTATDTALVTTPTTLVSEFLNYLHPKTIVGQFGTGNIPSLTRIPFNSRIQEQTTGGTANWVGAGIQKPVTRVAFDAQTVTWAKIAAIAVMQEELIRFSTPSGEGRVRDALITACVEKLDSSFIDPALAAVSNVSPASILYGVSALAHSGTNAAAVRTAVQAALDAYIGVDADVMNLVWLMPPTTALALQLMLNSLGQREFPDITMRGGMLEGFPVLTSRYLSTVQGSPASNIVALVNAAEIFLADDGGVNVDMSNQATIEMSDDPANDTGTQVNMFQTNQVAFRAERFITWARGRSSSVVWFNAVAWAA